jgi:site-specific DNA-methyltransferase (cytosine-N4-specific)
MSDINQRSNESGIQTTLDGTNVLEDWTFIHADTSYLTHGLHKYPPRMIPQIASKLNDRYVPKNGLILDPFCGSGTTLVEAILHGHSVRGNDINPFAILLSNVKSHPLNFKVLNFNTNEFLNYIKSNYNRAKSEDNLPDPPYDILPNFSKWFEKKVAIK